MNGKMLIVATTLVAGALAAPAEATLMSFTEDFRDGAVNDARLNVSPSLVFQSGQRILWAPASLTPTLNFTFTLPTGQEVESVEITFTDFTDPAGGSGGTDFIADAFNSGIVSPLDTFQDTEPPVVVEQRRHLPRGEPAVARQHVEHVMHQVQTVGQAGSAHERAPSFRASSSDAAGVQCRRRR